MGPSFDYPIQYVLHKQGLPLRVIAETRDNNWRKVEDYEGVTMWIHRTQLVSSKYAMVIGSDAASLRSKNKYNATIRAMLEPTVLVEVESCEEAWCRVSIGVYRGWLAKNRLWGVNP